MVFTPSKDTDGALQLQTTVTLTDLETNNANNVNSDRNPYVAIQFLTSKNAMEAKQDVIFCYYSKAWNTNPATETANDLWTCKDYVSTGTTLTGAVADATGEVRDITVENGQTKAWANNKLTTSFTFKRKYNRGDDQKDYVITDGEKLNIQYGYGVTTSKATLAGATSIESAATAVQLSQVNKPAASNAIVNFAASMLGLVGLVAYAF